MDGCKVVLIGGGSYNWTPNLAKDLFLKKNLKGSELVLVDVDKEAANFMRKYCNKMIKKIGIEWKVSVKELKPALKNADIVCVSISTPPRRSGGFEAMSNDYHIPEKYSIYHTVGDTAGPGGISRTLRNIPVFVEIAEKMEKYCPEAWLVHVTNPLSQLTRAVNKKSSIKCVGLCHNYAGTVSFLASFLGVGVQDIDATSVGVNHYTWLKDITCKGKPVADKLSLENYLEYEAENKDSITTNTVDDDIEAALGKETLNYYLNFELYERFGSFPVGNSCHVVENLPFYCNDEETLNKHHVRRKGVLPMRREKKEKNRQKVIDIVNGERELPELNMSREGFSHIVESLYTGKSTREIVAMANEGQVSNLPDEVIVETWAEVSANGISPVISGPIPEPLSGYMQMIIDEQEATVEAGLTGDRNKVYQAMAISPMVQNKDIVEDLTDELLEANKEYLPQFFKSELKF